MIFISFAQKYPAVDRKKEIFISNSSTYDEIIMENNIKETRVFLV